jgi:hypothetical protein
MAETTWTEEQTAGPKKKTIPTWAWFCGGGCLLAVLLAVVAAGFGFRFIKTATDPKVQWERLGKTLPHDEALPPEIESMFGNQFPIEQYVIQDTRGYQLQFQNHKGKDGSQARKQMFESDTPEFPQNMVVMKFDKPEPGSVEVQGRTLRLFRTRMEFSGLFGKAMPAEAKEAMGSMAFVDLTPEGREGMLMLQLTKMKGSEPVSDEEIRELLKPFHVGPNR